MKAIKNTPEAREKYNRAATVACDAWQKVVKADGRIDNEALQRAARLVRAVNACLIDTDQGRG